jgi:hypothetical protein
MYRVVLCNAVLSCHVLCCVVLHCLVLICIDNCDPNFDKGADTCLVLSCRVVPCLVLSRLLFSCFALSCLVLSCPVLSCPVLPSLVLPFCLCLSLTGPRMKHSYLLREETQYWNLYAHPQKPLDKRMKKRSASLLISASCHVAR